MKIKADGMLRSCYKETLANGTKLLQDLNTPISVGGTRIDVGNGDTEAICM